MAVSSPAVGEKKVVLPDASHPFAYLDGKPIYLDTVWRRALQEIIDKEAAIAVLTNAIRTEVNTQHP